MHVIRDHPLASSVLLLLAAFSQSAPADWINLTGAENAPDIAEIYIMDDHIRMVLEIFVDDIGLFKPLTKEAFSAIQLRTGKGESIEVSDIPVLERRVRIDRYSPFKDLGAAILWATVMQPPEDKRVLYAELIFKLDEKPDTIVVTPLTSKNGMALLNIGMLVYHKNVPVIDFRFLGGSETLHLDWDDPWYTRFENRNLSRHHQAALSSYLYIEPYEVRHEILIRPKDLAYWLGLGLADDKFIQPGELQPLLDRVGRFLLQRNPLTIDGHTVHPVLDRAEFVNIGLYGIQTVAPEEKIELNTAVLGVMLSYPTPGMPKRVQMQWDLFNERIQSVPATATDPAGPFISYLTPADNELVWDNFLKHYMLPQVELIPVKGEGSRGDLVLISSLAIALALIISMRINSRKRLPLLSATLLFSIAAIAFVNGKIPGGGFALKPMDQKDANRVLEALLKNVYHAFYLLDEEDVYDKLALTVSGDLLEQVYLQQRQSLEVQSAGGAQAKVSEVKLLESTLKTSRETANALVYDVLWTATGAVSHWGHTHNRTNLYQASITVSPEDDLWKISDLKIINEKRLMKPADPLNFQVSG